MISVPWVASASEPRLRLDASEALSCPNSQQVRDALVAALPGWQIEAGPAAPESKWLRLEPDGDHQVQLVIADPERPSEHRRVEVHQAECAEAAQTIALIAKVWLRHLPVSNGLELRAPLVSSSATLPSETSPRSSSSPSHAPDGERPEVHVSRQDSASSTATPGPSIYEPGEATPAHANASAAHGSASDPVAMGPTPGIPGPIPPLFVPKDETAGTKANAPPTSPPSNKSDPNQLKLHMTVLAGLVAFYNPDPGGGALGASGTLNIGIGERYGVVLGVGWDQSPESTSAAGNYQFHRLVGELSGEAVFDLPPDTLPGQLRLRGGALIEQLTLESKEIVILGPTQVFAPGAIFALYWDYALTSGLRLWAGPSMRYWLYDEPFNVPNAPVISAPRLWIGGTVGVGWRFF